MKSRILSRSSSIFRDSFWIKRGQEEVVNQRFLNSLLLHLQLLSEQKWEVTTDILEKLCNELSLFDDSDEIKSNILEYLNKITFLYCCGKSDAKLDYFSLFYFPNLRTITLDLCPLSTIYGLVELRPQLEEIFVTNTGISNLHSTFLPQIDPMRLKIFPPMYLGTLTKNKTQKEWIWTNLKSIQFSNCGINHFDETYHYFQSLTSLDISHNEIKHILHLQDCPLKHLDISYNQIVLLINLTRVIPHVLTLNLSNNQIENLDGLDQLHSLQFLDLSYNFIFNIHEIRNLVRLSQLKSLSLLENPLFHEIGEENYRAIIFEQFLCAGSVISTVEQMPLLDGEPISESEVIHLRNKLSSPNSQSSLMTLNSFSLTPQSFNTILNLPQCHSLAPSSTPPRFISFELLLSVPNFTSSSDSLLLSNSTSDSIFPLIEGTFLKVKTIPASTTNINRTPKKVRKVEEFEILEKEQAGASENNKKFLENEIIQESLISSDNIFSSESSSQISKSFRLSSSVYSIDELNLIIKEARLKFPQNSPTPQPPPLPPPPPLSLLRPLTQRFTKNTISTLIHQSSSPSSPPPTLSPSTSSTMLKENGVENGGSEKTQFDVNDPEYNDGTLFEPISEQATSNTFHYFSSLEGNHGGLLKIYTGESQYRKRLVHENLELYFREQVFGPSRPSKTLPYISQKIQTQSPSNGIEHEENEAIEQFIETFQCEEEKFVSLFHEKIILPNPSYTFLPFSNSPTSSTSPTSSPSPRNRSDSTVFEIFNSSHMENELDSIQTHIGIAPDTKSLDPSIELDILIVLTTVNLYFVKMDHIPLETLFEEAPIPRVFSHHPLFTLGRCTLFFGFQRISFSFAPYSQIKDIKDKATEEFFENINQGNESFVSIHYIIVTRDKAKGLPLSTKIPQTANVAKAAVSNLLTKVMIRNTDTQLLNKISQAAKILGGDGEILLYQMLFRTFRQHLNSKWSRSIILTSSRLFLCDEDLTDAMKVHLTVVDSASFSDLTEITEYENNPCKFKLVFKPPNIFSGSIKWRLEFQESGTTGLIKLKEETLRLSNIGKITIVSDKSMKSESHINPAPIRRNSQKHHKKSIHTPETISTISSLTTLPTSSSSTSNSTSTKNKTSLQFYVGNPENKEYSVLDHLELYFTEQVFGPSRPSNEAPYIRKPITTQSISSYEYTTTSNNPSSITFVDPPNQIENFIALFQERILVSSFGDLEPASTEGKVKENSVSEFISTTHNDEREVILLLTSINLYIIQFENLTSSILFKDAPIPLLIKFHPLYTLRNCTIFYHFQRCLLIFGNPNDSDMNEEFYEKLNDDEVYSSASSSSTLLPSIQNDVYSILTRDRARTLLLTTKIPQTANLAKSQVSKSLSKVKIQNTDRQMLNEMSKIARSFKIDSDIIYYQMLFEFPPSHTTSSTSASIVSTSTSTSEILLPRSLILTSSMLFLCEEDLTCPNLKLRVLDSIPCQLLSSIHYSDDPTRVKLIIKQDNSTLKLFTFSNTKRKWRLKTETNTVMIKMKEEIRKLLQQHQCLLDETSSGAGGNGDFVFERKLSRKTSFGFSPPISSSTDVEPENELSSKKSSKGISRRFSSFYSNVLGGTKKNSTQLGDVEERTLSTTEFNQSTQQLQHLPIQSYTGHSQYEELSVLNNLELYFKEQVFGTSRPSGQSYYIKLNSTSNTFDFLPQLNPTETLIQIFKEKTCPLAPFFERTLTNTSVESTDSDASSSEVDVILVLTSYALYFVSMDNVSHSVLFRDAPIPLFLRSHLLFTLRKCNIFFEYQRCSFHFAPLSTSLSSLSALSLMNHFSSEESIIERNRINSDSDFIDDTIYVILPREKTKGQLLTTKILQSADASKIQFHSTFFQNVKIQNHDSQLIESMNQIAKSLSVDSEIQYYQMLFQVSQQLPELQWPRSVVLTSSMLFLCEEDFTLATELKIKVIEQATYRDIDKITEHGDPTRIKIVFRSSNVFSISGSKKWRLKSDLPTSMNNLKTMIKKLCSEFGNSKV